MRKMIAGTILSIMAAGLAWAGTNFINYGTRIAILEEKEKTHKELLKEVRNDVKVLLQRVK